LPSSEAVVTLALVSLAFGVMFAAMILDFVLASDWLSA